MAEPLKAMYDEPFLRQFAALVHSAWTPFDQERFVALALDGEWEQLELKARMRRITVSLGACLPAAYSEALDILYAIDERCAGFPYLFFPDFVEVYGRDDWARSMDALARFTGKSTAEFAIRPFILAEPEKTMARMLEWADSEDEHIRRLASEGCRPRLPWAPALPEFKRDPSPIVPILEKLKADASLYVRKSVANNLNDIAKDHPELVLAIARRWSGRDERTDWIVRRGCRTLIKAADPAVMALFGYADEAASANVTQAAVDVTPGEARIGETTEIRYAAQVEAAEDAEAEQGAIKLRLELGVDYVKANGSVSRKKFLLKETLAGPGTRIAGAKRLSWADLTTRKHYPGAHRLWLLVNGRETAQTEMLLRGADEGDVP
ncbi:DNA alkylation repair protein [Paenibacillus xanthanilyticus]|uniref:DNA alkylation repair protein n=1 Tax=Paenibacillus xanthanilyticus TaxID=1783531 RepID=A0ABV8K0H4_9BACL